MIDLNEYIFDKKRLSDIRRAFKRRFDNFVKGKWSETPFLDKPNKPTYGSSASIGVRTKSEKTSSITIYGGRPNIARMKGYNAPVGKYIDGKDYKVRFGSHFYTMKKYQKKASNPSPYDDLPGVGQKYKYQYYAVKDYAGSNVPVGFRNYAPGRAILTYWENTIADYFFEKYEDEIILMLDDCVDGVE